MKWSGINWKDVLTPRGLLSIVEGCTEAIKQKAGIENEFVKSAMQYRLDFICAHCDLNTDGQCDPTKTGTVVQDFTYHRSIERKQGELVNGCGCALKCKTANVKEECPLGKWLSAEN